MKKTKEVCHVSNFLIEGRWRDKIYHKTKRGKEVLFKEIKGHNIITQPFTLLISALLANNPSLLGGILFHAVGEGAASWDTSGIPNPSKFDTKLLAELNRRPPDGITYIKYGIGKAVNGTNTTIIDPERLENGQVTGRFEPDNFFNGMTVKITAGTNNGLSRTVLDYTQATGEIVVDVPFPVPIDNTSEYEFEPEASTAVTNVIEIRTTWDYGNPSDPINFKYIREQGLFGGTAINVPNSGFMIDRITHERIWKEPTTKLVRFIDLIFRV